MCVCLSACVFVFRPLAPTQSSSILHISAARPGIGEVTSIRLKAGELTLSSHVHTCTYNKVGFIYIQEQRSLCNRCSSMDTWNLK